MADDGKQDDGGESFPTFSGQADGRDEWQVKQAQRANAHREMSVLWLVELLKRQNKFALIGGPGDGEVVTFQDSPPRIYTCKEAEYELKIVSARIPGLPSVEGYLWTGLRRQGEVTPSIPALFARQVFAKAAEADRCAKVRAFLCRVAPRTHRGWEDCQPFD